VGFSGAHIVRRTSQGLGVETDLSAPRAGDLAHPAEDRTRRDRTTAVAISGTAQNGISAAGPGERPQVDWAP